AVLAAIAVPEILMAGDATLPDLTSPRAIAGILAALVAWRSGSTWLTIAAGMGALWLTQWLGL
ncbi:MAG: AzlD domain-containing protein, partial [Anaerolineales bacterium]